MAKVREGNTRLQVSISTKVANDFGKLVSERKKGPVVEKLLRKYVEEHENQ